MKTLLERREPTHGKVRPKQLVAEDVLVGGRVDGRAPVADVVDAHGGGQCRLERVDEEKQLQGAGCRQRRRRRRLSGRLRR